MKTKTKTKTYRTIEKDAKKGEETWTLLYTAYEKEKKKKKKEKTFLVK